MPNSAKCLSRSEKKARTSNDGLAENELKTRVLEINRLKQESFGLKPDEYYLEGRHCVVSVFGVFLVRIFPHSDGIPGDRVSLRIQSEAGKYRPEKL